MRFTSLIPYPVSRFSTMPLIQIIHKRCECIGCGFCTEVAPGYWFMNGEGEAELHTILGRQDKFEYGEGLFLDRERLAVAAAGCPVKIIQMG